jgi:hypothetical protein
MSKKTIKRLAFKRYVTNKCHDNYYFLTKHMNDATLALALSLTENQRTLENWVVFIARDLFMLPTKGDANFYKIGKTMWDFFRLTNNIINYMFYKCGIKREDRDLERFLTA